MRKLHSSILMLTVLISFSAVSIVEGSSTTTVGNAEKDASKLVIYPSAVETQPLEVGDAFPTFNVQEVDGSAKTFFTGERDKPLMVVVFLGGWCPFCNLHLEELQKVVPELSEAGMEIAFFSGDRPEVLFEALEDDVQTIAKTNDYVIYSDANFEAASALGIAYGEPPKELLSLRLRSRVIDFRGATDGPEEVQGTLPVPSVFIVDTNGEVAFVYTNPDYKVRLSAEDTRAAGLAVLNNN